MIKIKILILIFLIYSTSYGQSITKIRVANFIRMSDPNKRKILYEKIYYNKFDNVLEERMYEEGKLVSIEKNKYIDSFLVESNSYRNGEKTEKTVFRYDKKGKIKKIKTLRCYPNLVLYEYSYSGDSLEIEKIYEYNKSKKVLTLNSKTIKNADGKIISKISKSKSDTTINIIYTYFGDSLIIKKDLLEGKTVKTYLSFDSMHRIKKELLVSENGKDCKEYFYQNNLLVLMKDSTRNSNPTTTFIYWSNRKIKEERDIDEDDRGIIQHFDSDGNLKKKEVLSFGKIITTIFYKYSNVPLPK